MGWDFTKKPTDIKEFFKNEYEFSGNKVLDIEIHKNKEVYIALKIGSTSEVTALVVLLQTGKERNFEFGYKTMDESVHPFYYNCPARIFNLLTPTTSQNAKDWRAKVSKKLKLQF